MEVDYCGLLNRGAGFLKSDIGLVDGRADVLHDEPCVWQVPVNVESEKAAAHTHQGHDTEAE